MRAHLVHLRACEASGEALKQYAKRKGLSVDALYQAKRVLRKRGTIAAPVRRASNGRHDRGPKDPVRRFVEVIAPPHSEATSVGGAAWRIRLPGGAVLESRTPLGVDEVVRLLEALGARP